MVDNKYMAEYMLVRYKKRMQEYIKYLGGKCVNCESIEQLQFDHIDKTTKSFTIGKNWNLSKEKILPELAKCQLLCRDCHIQKSKLKKDFSHPGSNQYVKNKIINRHGKLAGYNDGCRCIDCKEWKKKYRNKLVDAQNNIRAGS